MRLAPFAAFAALMLASPAAFADVIDKFNISADTGDGPVSGWFELDVTNPGLYAYSFATPNGPLYATLVPLAEDSSGFAFDFTGTIPTGSFFEIEVESDDTTQHMSMIFNGSIETFTGGAIYPGLANPNVASGISCNPTPDCGGFSGADQLDGSATFDSSFSVPEPATWALMLTGFAGLGAAIRIHGRGGLARKAAAERPS
jgi:hypothetical protein